MRKVRIFSDQLHPFYIGLCIEAGSFLLMPDVQILRLGGADVWLFMGVILIVNLDVMMGKRKISLNELSDKVGFTLGNRSILKTRKAIRDSTLDAICKALDCQPGDILEFTDSNE